MNQNIFNDDIKFENTVCKMGAISLRPQHIEEWDGDKIASRFPVPFIFLTRPATRYSTTSSLHEFLMEM